MKITEIALKKRLTTFVLIFVVIITGSYSYINMPKEAAPDITIPFIFISTPYFGVSPDDMENLVTNVIERELKTLDDVEAITSTSQESFSMISVEFVAGADIDQALQKVRDKVDLAKPDLPRDAEDPLISELNFSDWPIMIINVSGKMGLVGLKKIAEDLEDVIETVPGVIEATITGGLTREVQVNLDPPRLSFYNLSVTDVIDAVRNEHLDTPGGSIDIGDTKFLVRIPGEFAAPEKMNDIVVKVKNDRPIYLRDLGEVIYSFKERGSISRLNGVETVSITVQKRSGENLLEIADRVKELIATQQEKLPPGIEIKITADLSLDIRMMVDELENNVASGLILVVLVLLVVMGVRNALLVGIAIPMSMLLSFLVLDFMGQTMNMVVLFSLILAVGMLVDNAIVIVENIFRHNQEGMGLWESALKGSEEVGMAVTASTLTTVCAFLPLLRWPGIMGEFMIFLPITLITTLLSSLFVALVFNPAICSRYLRPSETVRMIEAKEEKLGLILRNYLYMLQAAMRRPLVTFFSSLGLLVLILIAYALFGHGVEFMPSSEPQQLQVNITAPTGTRLETSNRLVQKVEQIVRELPDIKNYVANVGGQGSSTGDFTIGAGATHRSQVTIDFIDREDRSQSSWTTRDRLRERIDQITGGEIEVTEQEQGPPTGPPINIELSGDDFALLGQIAGDIRRLIGNAEGVVDIKDDFDAGRPELRVRVDREKAALLGLSTSEVAFTIRTAINGTEAAKYRVGDEEYDITVRFALEKRSSIEDLKNINIFHEDAQIPLSNLAHIETKGGAGTILHKDMKRMVTVSAKVEGRNENEALLECQELLRGFELPAGYMIEFTGQQKEQEESAAFLTEAFLLAIILISMVLISQFNSLTLPFVIMFSVILSMIGVMAGLMITGTPFGIIMTGMGVISLAGVVVNNAIVLIDYIQKLRVNGMGKEAAIIQAGLVRFRPVLMTAITTILGLLPLTTGYGFNFKTFEFQSGGEMSQWWGSMGVAVIFGLAFATLLTLVVVPVMYKLLTDVADRFGVKPAFQRKAEFAKMVNGITRTDDDQ